jgi:FKBP-type peptidyl-prolyl cis-trans isomerase SlpA
VKHQIGIASRVTLHLSLTLEDGTVAESTFGEAPLSFTMGDGSLVHGLELALYGLRPGDTQRLELYPEQAFGLREPEKIHHLPRSQFSPDMALEPGLIIGFTSQDGEEIPGAVLSVDDESVEVDFNHPMAGHTVIFEVEILDVVPGEGAEE